MIVCAMLIGFSDLKVYLIFSNAALDRVLIGNRRYAPKTAPTPDNEESSA
jgi:hypothetical protein